MGYIYVRMLKLLEKMKAIYLIINFIMLVLKVACFQILRIPAV